MTTHRSTSATGHQAEEARVAYALNAPASARGGAFRLSPLERANLVKRGVPARLVQDLSKAMGLSRDQLMQATGLARSTVERKIAARQTLSERESEKLVGLSRLIGQVDAMVHDSAGAPADFNAARWFARWMGQPVAALGGLCPQELLDTADGREALGTLLLQMRSGVYA